MREWERDEESKKIFHIIISVIFFFIKQKFFLLFLLFWHHMSGKEFLIVYFLFASLLTLDSRWKNVITDSLDVLRQLKIQKGESHIQDQNKLSRASRKTTGDEKFICYSVWTLMKLKQRIPKSTFSLDFSTQIKIKKNFFNWNFFLRRKKITKRNVGKCKKNPFILRSFALALIVQKERLNKWKYSRPALSLSRLTMKIKFIVIFLQQFSPWKSQFITLDHTRFSSFSSRSSSFTPT